MSLLFLCNTKRILTHHLHENKGEIKLKVTSIQTNIANPFFKLRFMLFESSKDLSFLGAIFVWMLTEKQMNGCGR